MNIIYIRHQYYLVKIFPSYAYQLYFTLPDMYVRIIEHDEKTVCIILYL